MSSIHDSPDESYEIIDEPEPNDPFVIACLDSDASYDSEDLEFIYVDPSECLTQQQNVQLTDFQLLKRIGNEYFFDINKINEIIQNISNNPSTIELKNRLIETTKQMSYYTFHTITKTIEFASILCEALSYYDNTF